MAASVDGCLAYKWLHQVTTACGAACGIQRDSCVAFISRSKAPAVKISISILLCSSSMHKLVGSAQGTRFCQQLSLQALSAGHPSSCPALRDTVHNHCGLGSFMLSAERRPICVSTQPPPWHCSFIMHCCSDVPLWAVLSQNSDRVSMQNPHTLVLLCSLLREFRAGRFVTMVCSFCERLDDPSLKAVLGEFKKRLDCGVKAEAQPLMEIKCRAVQGYRAGLLYRGGLRTPAEVAMADEAR